MHVLRCHCGRKYAYQPLSLHLVQLCPRCGKMMVTHSHGLPPLEFRMILILTLLELKLLASLFVK